MRFPVQTSKSIILLSTLRQMCTDDFLTLRIQEAEVWSQIFVSFSGVDAQTASAMLSVEYEVIEPNFLIFFIERSFLPW